MSKNIFLLLLIWTFNLMLSSCSTKYSTSEANVSKITYKARLLDSPGAKIIVVEAISNSGRRVIRAVGSGMTLYFNGPPSPFSERRYLETLQNPKAHYDITDYKWTEIIRIHQNNKQLQNEISAIRFNLDSGNGGESVTINIKSATR